MSSVELPPLAPAVDWSVCVRDAVSGTVLAQHQPDHVQRTASVGKLFLLLEVARRLEDGSLSPHEPLTWRDEETVEDSGLWYRLSTRTLPVVDLCALVGAVSDNLATNVLLRHVGVESVSALTRSLGYVDSALLDRVRDHRGPDDPPTLSRGTAAELSDLMVRLERGQAVSPGVSAQVHSWLSANTDLSMVASAFGLDPLAHDLVDRGYRLVDKTGTISAARIDVGVVEGPRRSVAWAALAEWPDGTDPRDDVLATMAALGASLRAHVD